MDIVPVIDLLGNRVVRARQGRRESYRPIETPLSATSEPGDVAAALRRLFAFRRLYVADLDAIEGRGANTAAIAALSAASAGADLWVDAGIASPDGARALLADGHSLVVGSESQTGTEMLSALHEHPRVILSLDFRGESFQGPPALLNETALWPRRIILMTLARVGAKQGPDIARLTAIAAQAPATQLYAAGGVRNAADLRALAAAGAAGALVATSLHDGTLSRSDLDALMQGSRSPTSPARGRGRS